MTENLRETLKKERSETRKAFREDCENMGEWEKALVISLLIVATSLTLYEYDMVPDSVKTIVQILTLEKDQ